MSISTTKSTLFVAFLIATVFASPASAPAQWNPVLSNGNINGDGELDISDAVSLLQWLFNGGPAPAAPEFCCTGCLCNVQIRENGDVNGDGDRDISDAIHLLRYLFEDGHDIVDDGHLCGCDFEYPDVDATECIPNAHDQCGGD